MFDDCKCAIRVLKSVDILIKEEKLLIYVLVHGQEIVKTTKSYNIKYNLIIYGNKL